MEEELVANIQDEFFSVALLDNSAIVYQEPDFDYLTDQQGSLIYHGKAFTGSSTSLPVWRIWRFDTSVHPNSEILKADADAFTQVWDNRLTLTYS